MKRLVIALAAGCSLFWVSAANAQTCLGNTSHSAAPRQAGADVAFATNSVAFGGGYGGGNDKFFARGGAQLAHHSGGDGNTKAVFGMAGREFAVDADKKLFVCPNATVAFVWVPTGDEDFSETGQLYQFAANVGFLASKSGEISIVPTAGFGIMYGRSKFTDKFFDPPQTETGSNTATVLQFGVGLIFNDKMAITPSFHISIDEGFTDTAFSTLFTMKVGK